MPIEGTLREFGIHDVFQLLDMSRKTGMLRVSSRLRADEGQVYFERGRVVHATLHSQPSAPAAAGISDRDVERRVRRQIETAVYDLMNWRDGSFSFEERSIEELPSAARVVVPTESLLMEGARRVDEWSRIASKVPDVAVVPMLAQAPPDHESQLNLLPHEWEVLAAIDGERDLRSIASALGRGEFEIAKVVYGLVTTGVVDIRQVRRPSVPVPEVTVNPSIQGALDRGFRAAREGDFGAARSAWEEFLVLAPHDPAAPRVRRALDALITLVDLIQAGADG